MDKINERFIDLTGNYSWSGTHTFSAGTIIVKTPISDNEAATKAYVDLNTSGDLSLTAKVNTISANLNIVSGDLDTAENNISTLTTNVNTISANLNTISGDLNTVESDILTLSGNLNTVTTNVNTISANVNTISGNLTTLTTNVNTISANVNTISGNLNTLTTNVNTISANLNTISGDLNTAESDIINISGDLNIAESDIITLSGAVEALSVSAISVSAGDGLLKNGVELSVNQAFDFNWTGVNTFSGGTIIVKTPTSDNEAATKAYVDAVSGGDTTQLRTDVNTISGDLNIAESDIVNLRTDVNTVSGNVNTISGNLNILTTNVNTISANVNTISGNLNTVTTNYVSGGISGLSKTAGVLALNINGLTESTSPNLGDLIVLYDVSAATNKKITRANYIKKYDYRPPVNAYLPVSSNNVDISFPLSVDDVPCMKIVGNATSQQGGVEYIFVSEGRIPTSISLRYKVSATSGTVDLYLYDTTGTMDASGTGFNSTSMSTIVLSGATVNGTYVAGQYIRVRAIANVSASDTAHVGDVKMAFN